MFNKKNRIIDQHYNILCTECQCKKHTTSTVFNKIAVKETYKHRCNESQACTSKIHVHNTIR